MITSGSDRVITLFSDLPRECYYTVSSINGEFACLVHEDGEHVAVCRALLPGAAKADSVLFLRDDGRFELRAFDEADQLIRTTMQVLAPKVAALVDMSERQALTYIEEALLSEGKRLLSSSR